MVKMVLTSCWPTKSTSGRACTRLPNLKAVLTVRIMESVCTSSPRVAVTVMWLSPGANGMGAVFQNGMPVASPSWPPWVFQVIVSGRPVTMPLRAMARLVTVTWRKALGCTILMTISGLSMGTKMRVSFLPSSVGAPVPPKSGAVMIWSDFTPESVPTAPL